MKRMKKGLLLFTVCLTMISSNVIAQRNIKITLNGKEIKTDAAPFIKNNRTLVPIRFISEALNYDVKWNEKAQTVNINNQKDTLDLKINSDKVLVNGDEKTIDVAPVIYKNRTFVPIRFVSENLGVNVGWNDKTSTVILSDKEESLKYPELTKEENNYIIKQKSIADNIAKDMKDIKSYYFENSSKFSNSEIKQQVSLIVADLDKNYKELYNLTPPQRFKQSYDLFMKAMGTARVIVSTYDKALLNSNPEEAKNLMALQTDYSVKIKEATDCMNAELKGEKYVPNKDIEQYKKNGDEVLDSNKLNDLLQSFGL